MSTSYALQKRDQVAHMAITIGDLVEEHGLVTVEYKVGRTRSKFQQAALQVWCRQTADLFNEQEIARAIKSPIFKSGEMEAPWSPEAVKYEIWRPIQKAMTGHDSTTKPTPQEYIQIFDYIVRAFGTKGVRLPDWPVRKPNDDQKNSR